MRETTRGNNNQRKNNKRMKMDHTNNPIERPITLTKRINTLMSLPCQSVCPNMGTNKFLSHSPGAICLFVCCMARPHFKKICLAPAVYHQTGKYTISKKKSSAIRCNTNTHIYSQYLLLISVTSLPHNEKISHRIGRCTCTTYLRLSKCNGGPHKTYIAWLFCNNQVKSLQTLLNTFYRSML